jgi:hypothetical protein
MVLVSMMHFLCVQAGDAAEQSEGSKKKWFDEKKKRQEEQLAKMGLTPEDAHRLESAEVAEAKYKKKVRTSLLVVCIGATLKVLQRWLTQFLVVALVLADMAAGSCRCLPTLCSFC